MKTFTVALKTNFIAVLGLLTFSTAVIAAEVNAQHLVNKTDPASVPAVSVADATKAQAGKEELVDAKNDYPVIMPDDPILPETFKVIVPAGTIFPFQVTLVDVSPTLACPGCIVGVYVTSKGGHSELIMNKATGELFINGKLFTGTQEEKAKQVQMAIEIANQIAMKTKNGTLINQAKMVIDDLKKALLVTPPSHDIKLDIKPDVTYPYRTIVSDQNPGQRKGVLNVTIEKNGLVYLTKDGSTIPFPSTTISYSLDKSTGVLTVSETNFTPCPPNQYCTQGAPVSIRTIKPGDRDYNLVLNDMMSILDANLNRRTVSEKDKKALQAVRKDLQQFILIWIQEPPVVRTGASISAQFSVK